MYVPTWHTIPDIPHSLCSIHFIFLLTSLSDWLSSRRVHRARSTAGYRQDFCSWVQYKSTYLISLSHSFHSFLSVLIPSLSFSFPLSYSWPLPPSFLLLLGLTRIITMTCHSLQHLDHIHSLRFSLSLCLLSSSGSVSMVYARTCSNLSNIDVEWRMLTPTQKKPKVSLPYHSHQETCQPQVGEERWARGFTAVPLGWLGQESERRGER